MDDAPQHTNNDEWEATRQQYHQMVYHSACHILENRFAEWAKEAVSRGNAVEQVVAEKFPRELVREVFAQKETDAFIKFAKSSDVQDLRTLILAYLRHKNENDTL